MPKLAYTPAEAAVELGISERRVRDAIRSGEVLVVGPKINGRQASRDLVIRHEELVEWRDSWQAP